MASKQLRGITLQIGGDTTKLGQALADSEKKTRSLQTELRQVEKLLQFDPTNTELLIQKQNILADMISQTSKKLDVMRDAEEQVIAQFERGEIAEDQLRAFQREIIQTEKNLNDMSDELKKATRNLDEFGDNNGIAKAEAKKLEQQIKEQNDALEEEKKKLDQAEKAQQEHEQAVEEAKEAISDFTEETSGMVDGLKTGATLLGATTIAVGGYALNMSTQFDKAFNSLVAKTGIADDQMEDFNTTMENIYANNYGESIEDVADSMAIVYQQTWTSGEELQKLTEHALTMRDVFDFEVSESTRSATMLMNQFGITGDQAYNLIVQGAQNGLDKNGDLLDTINEYSVHFAQLGFSAEDMFNMLDAGAVNGAFSIDKLGDAIKEFGIRVKDGSAEDAFKSMKLNVDDITKAFGEGGEKAQDAFYKVLNGLSNITDPIEQNTAGVAIFSTMWEDLGADAVLAMSDMSDMCNQNYDSMNQLNEIKYDDIGSALGGLKRTLETDVIVPLGEELKPTVEEIIGYVKDNAPKIKELLSKIIDKVGDFIKFIKDNGNTILGIIAGIGTAFITWKVAGMISGLIGVVTSFVKVLKTGKSVMGALNAVMSMNPIILIVTLIAGLVVAFITLWNTSEDFRNFWIELWEKIKAVCGAVIDAIVSFFTETIPNAIRNFIDKAKEFFTNIIDFVKNNWQEILLFIINPFAGAFALAYKHCEGFRTFVDNFVNTVKQFFIDAWNSIVTFFTETIPAFISNVITWLTELPNKIGYGIGYIIGLVVKFGLQLIEWAKTEVPKFINNVITFISQLPGKFWDWLTKTITNVINFGVNLVNKGKEVASNFVTNVINFIKEMPGKLWNAIVNGITFVANWGNDIKNKATSAIGNTVTSVFNTAKQIPSKIWDAIVGAINKVKTWGTNMLTTAKKAVSDVAKAIKNGFLSIPNAIKDIGKNIVEGLWNGISNMTGWITDKVKGFAGSILGGIKGALGIHSPSRVMRDEVGRYISEGIGVGIVDNADSAIDGIDTLADDMVNHANKINGITLNRQIAHKFSGELNNTSYLNQLIAKLDNYLPKIIEASNRQMVLDTGVLIAEVDKGLATNQILKTRGV